MGGVNTWTEEQIAELKSLWDHGDSASVIARQMKTTRNAILGKVHRLGLEPRGARNGSFYGSMPAAKEKKYRSVFKSREIRPPRPKPYPSPKTLIAISSLTGAFMEAKRISAAPEYTKAQLRAQLTQAVINTARMA